MNRRYYTGGDLSRAVSFEDLREMAHRRLPRFSLEYVEGGSEDELTLKRNRDVFSRITWVPRTLAASGMPELGVEIMGQPCHMPLVIAPTGFNGLLWPQGDLALARAAAAAGIPFTLSTASNYDYRQLVRDVDGQMWYQLYPFKDQKMVDAIIDRLEQAGCRVLVVTSDFPSIGAREWDQRNYRSPMKLSAGSILDLLAHPRWLWQVMVPHGAPRFANVVDFLPHGSKSALLGAKYLSNQLNTMLAWPDMERLRTRWKGKLVIKGVLAIEDARRAAAIGADAIVLSNHGGRQLDSTIAGIEALPAVAAELREKITILVDGGFRRGADVLKAMALGAHGVMLGRATLYGLAAGGEPGVTRALAMLRSEMERVMTLLGCRTMSELGRHLIRS